MTVNFSSAINLYLSTDKELDSEIYNILTNDELLLDYNYIKHILCHLNNIRFKIPRKNRNKKQQFILEKINKILTNIVTNKIINIPNNGKLELYNNKYNYPPLRIMSLNQLFIEDRASIFSINVKNL